MLENKKFVKIILGIIFIAWFGLVYIFSSQTGRQSSKISDKVTRKLLQTKDTLEVVIENYEKTNDIFIKRS